METLTMNDGTVFENSRAHESIERLFVYIRAGLTLQEVFEVLINPEKTKKIVMNQYGENTTFRGYKKLIAISDEGDGFISATLRKA